DELLSGAAFAVDEDAAIGGRSDADLLAKSFHGDAVAEDLVAVAQLGTKRLVFFFEVPLLNGVADKNDDFFECERLFDEIEGAEFGGADGSVNGGVAGNHDDRRRMRERLDAGKGFETVHAGEPDVEEDHIKAAVGCPLDGALGRVGGFGDVAFVGEDGRQGFADAGFVVDDKDLRFRGHPSFRSAKYTGKVQGNAEEEVEAKDQRNGRPSDVNCPETAGSSATARRLVLRASAC